MTALLTPREVSALNQRFHAADPQVVLAWGLDRFGARMAISSSFGAEDVALIDMAWRIRPRVRVFTLDTLRLHTETYATLDAVHERYGIEVEIVYPDLAEVDRMVRARGYNLFYHSVENRKLCCGIRKVEPLGRALADLDAWATGLRSNQAATRVDTQRIEIDEVHGGILKLNPLADWTGEQVWDYIREHEVPYNALHDQGFPSIGCAPCTRAVLQGEDPRAGRWWWEADAVKECGIHVGYDANGQPRVVRAPEAAP